MHKQTTGDLQRARTALQALRATHVAEIKRREKEIEAIRERWSKLSDAQLKIGTMPSGMSVSSSCLQPANASALVRWSDGAAAAAAAGDAAAQKGRAIHDVALEEAEKACVGLREQNGELKALVVEAANAVCKILHKALSSDPDDLEFVRPSSSSLFLWVVENILQGDDRSLLPWPRSIFFRLALPTRPLRNLARCSLRFEMRLRCLGLATLFLRPAPLRPRGRTRNRKYHWPIWQRRPQSRTRRRTNGRSRNCALR